jgi:hypothetical protein
VRYFVRYHAKILEELLTGKILAQPSLRAYSSFHALQYLSLRDETNVALEGRDFPEEFALLSRIPVCAASKLVHPLTVASA